MTSLRTYRIGVFSSGSLGSVCSGNIQLPLQVGIQKGSVLCQALAMGTSVINKQTLAWNAVVILPRQAPNFLIAVRHQRWLHSRPAEGGTEH